MAAIALMLASCDNPSAPDDSAAPVTDAAPDAVSEAGSPVETSQADADTSGAPTEPSSDGHVFYDSDATGNFELYVRRADGSIAQLTDDPEWDSWWVRPSPDRDSIIFYRTPAGTHDRDFTATTLWRANADGSEARPLIEPGAHGWDQHGHAEWSPNGSRLAMFGGGQINPQIWITDAEGGEPRQLTDGPGINVDPSWSPDGSTVVYVGCPVRLCFQPRQEIYSIPAQGGERFRLTDDDVRDQDPYVAPDGSFVAFLTQTVEPIDGVPFGYWDIRTVPTGGGDIATLTPGDQVFSLPRFAADGTIWTHRLVYGSNQAFDIVTVDPSSGRVTEIIATASSEEYPSP